MNAKLTHQFEDLADLEKMVVVFLLFSEDERVMLFKPVASVSVFITERASFVSRLVCDHGPIRLQIQTFQVFRGVVPGVYSEDKTPICSLSGLSTPVAPVCIRQSQKVNLWYWRGLFIFRENYFLRSYFMQRCGVQY